MNAFDSRAKILTTPRSPVDCNDTHSSTHWINRQLTIPLDKIYLVNNCGDSASKLELNADQHKYTRAPTAPWKVPGAILNEFVKNAVRVCVALQHLVGHPINQKYQYNRFKRKMSNTIPPLVCDSPPPIDDLASDDDFSEPEHYGT